MGALRLFLTALSATAVSLLFMCMPAVSAGQNVNQVSLERFSCDSAVGRGNFVILPLAAATKEISFSYKFIGRAAPDTAPAFYVTFSNKTDKSESLVFWHTPSIAKPGEEPVAADSIAGSMHAPIFGKGSAIDVAQLKRDRADLSINGPVIIRLRPGSAEVETNHILPGIKGGRSSFKAASSLGAPVRLQLGCFYGEYEFEAVTIS